MAEGRSGGLACSACWFILGLIIGVCLAGCGLLPRLEGSRVCVDGTCIEVHDETGGHPVERLPNAPEPPESPEGENR